MVRCGALSGAATAMNPDHHQIMKSLLHLLRDIILLPTTGCIFPGNRDHSDIQSRPGHEHHEEHRTIVEHKEYPVNPLSVSPDSIPKQYASHGR
jgi:hypothetical protein